MSSKVEKPTLQGQRIKTRKRDEKEKYDPNAFRDIILQGVQEIISGSKERAEEASELAGQVATLEISSEPTNGDAQSQAGDTASEDEDSESSKPTDVSASETLTVNPVAETLNAPTAKTLALVSGRELIFEKAQYEALSKFLDVSGSKLNYRRYGDVLLDIIIAGGILAPGGSIVANSDPTKPSKTDFCLFSVSETNLDGIREFAQVIHKLIRRYLYLEKILDEEIKKLLLFLKGFQPATRVCLAKFVALLIAIGQIPATVLVAAVQESTVKDGIALDFFTEVLRLWLAEKDAQSVWSTLKKSGVDNRIMTFLPANKQSFEHLKTAFEAAGLHSLLELQKAGKSSGIKKKLQSELASLINDRASNRELLSVLKESMAKHSLAEHEVAIILWNTVMAANEWNKKEDLIADQAIKYLRGFVQLFASFTTNPKSALLLMNRIQEYCYENMSHLKAFSKIILLFYKTDVLDEDTIFRWYRESHSSKGKSVFLEQMKKFIEWLENAEEESEEE